MQFSLHCPNIQKDIAHYNFPMERLYTSHHVNTTKQVILLPFVFLFFISHIYASKDTKNNGTATDNIVIASFLFFPRKPLDFLVYLAAGNKNNCNPQSERDINEYLFRKMRAREEDYLTQTHPHEHLDPPLHLYTLKCQSVHRKMKSNRIPYR